MPVVNQSLMMAIFNKTIMSGVRRLLDDHDPCGTGKLSYVKHKNDILSTLEEIYCETISMSSPEFDLFIKHIDQEGTSFFGK